MVDEEAEVKAKAFAMQAIDIHLANTPVVIQKSVIPKEKMIKDHLFLLKYTCNNKNTANKEALKYHKQGYHTRVIETSPGVFSLYRRDQPTVRVRHGKKFIPPPPPA